MAREVQVVTFWSYLFTRDLAQGEDPLRSSVLGTYPAFYWRLLFDYVSNVCPCLPYFHVLRYSVPSTNYPGR